MSEESTAGDEILIETPKKWKLSTLLKLVGATITGVSLLVTGLTTANSLNTKSDKALAGIADNTTRIEAVEKANHIQDREIQSLKELIVGDHSLVSTISRQVDSVASANGNTTEALKEVTKNLIELNANFSNLKENMKEMKSDIREIKNNK